MNGFVFCRLFICLLIKINVQNEFDSFSKSAPAFIHTSRTVYRSMQNISDFKIRAHPPHAAHGSWRVQQGALVVLCLGSSSLKDILLGRSATFKPFDNTGSLKGYGVGKIILAQRIDTPAFRFWYWIICPGNENSTAAFKQPSSILLLNNNSVISMEKCTTLRKTYILCPSLLNAGWRWLGHF